MAASAAGVSKTLLVKILIISNDTRYLCELIDYMERRNFRTTCLSNATDVIRHLDHNHPDFVIFDLEQKNEPYPRLLNTIKSRSNARVIAVIEHDPDEFNRVTPLELGADDCLTRPVCPQEVVARVRAILRRVPVKRAIDPPVQSGNCRFAGWELDLDARRLTNPDGMPVALSPGNYALLVAFIRSPERTLTRDFLMQVTRFEGNVSPKSVDVQVLRLRRKLAKRPNTRELIEADPGIGYRFTASVTRSKAGLVPTTVVAFAA